MKTIHGNLVLKEDTRFEEDLKVEGDIVCEDDGRFSLTVAGDIDAFDIIVGNIIAGDIDAFDIDALNINAVVINAGDIDAKYIICEKRIKKTKNSKTTARMFITKASKLKKKFFKV